MPNGNGTASHELIMCSLYENEDEQPLKVFISLEYAPPPDSRSLIVMHIHAHLFKTEIIGYVAGYFFTMKSTSKHTQKQVLYIHETIPCESLEQGEGPNNDPENIAITDRSKNVEMDPESAANALRQAQ